MINYPLPPALSCIASLPTVARSGFPALEAALAEDKPGPTAAKSEAAKQTRIAADRFSACATKVNQVIKADPALRSDPETQAYGRDLTATGHLLSRMATRMQEFARQKN